MPYETASIDSINSLKSELDALSPLTIEHAKRLKKKFRLEFNYNSNHIEGNTLTYGQTQLLLLFDKSSGDVPVSDLEEMKAHDLALTQLEEMANDQERPLTEQFIRELNKLILVKPFWKEAIDYSGNPTRKLIKIGEYKDTPNSVRLRNGEIHEYASPEETPIKMTELIAWYQANESILHPVHLAAEFHYRFVCIHPFDDGNGRVARLVMNYILIKHDYPLVVIKSDDKENYLTALQKADTGNVLALIEYIEQQAIWSLELAIKAAKGEDLEEYDDLDKEIALLKKDKLTKSTIYKTPKVAFSIYTHINDRIWIPLNKVLDKFNEFFVETTTEYYVNRSKIEKTKTISNHSAAMALMLSEKVVPVIEYDVFGHDLSKKDIKVIEWRKNLMSLMSASTKTDISIHFVLKLNNSNYVLSIGIGNGKQTYFNSFESNLFEVENKYQRYLMQIDIEKITRLVSNHLLEFIQSAE